MKNFLLSKDYQEYVICGNIQGFHGYFADHQKATLKPTLQERLLCRHSVYFCYIILISTTVQPCYSAFQGTGQNILYQGLHYCQNIDNYGNIFLTEICMLHQRNYVKSECAIAGFHSINIFSF